MSAAESIPVEVPAEPEAPPAQSPAIRWLDERFGVSKLIAWAQHKEVPVGGHSMVWYYLGGTTLFFFTVQIVSGVLLLMYYQPGETTSYESIRYITTKVPFGWLIRSVHCWSAHLMILSLLVHMLSTMVLKAYRKPRELTWLSGFALFGVALGFGFSGYLLPWNELAFFATAVGTDSVKSVPIVGQWLLEVMRGGPDVTINTLYRFFALHVLILPLTALAIIGGHLAFIQIQGMAPHMAHQKKDRPGLKFFPDFVVRDLLLWLCCLIVLSSLVYLLPYGPGIPGAEWELGKKANPLAPAYPGIKPEWYFLWIYQLLKEFPAHLFGMEGPQAAVAVVSVLMGIWALVPFLDRRSRRGQSSPLFTDLATAALIFISYLMLKAWDIGGKATGATGLPDPRATAWTCSLIVLGAGAAVTILRTLAYRQRYFVLSLAALLQIGLNGLAGVGYLLSGAIALTCAIVGMIISSRMSTEEAS
jgi:cytochrome b6